MNYYKRHIGDYAAATRHLSMIEHGAYALLLDVYYTSEAPLPPDIKAAARKAGARTKDEIAAVEAVLIEFFSLEDDGWHQRRCDTEIAAMRAKSETNREVGRLGGRPRKKTQTVSTQNPDGFQDETQTVPKSGENGNQNETLATSHKPLTNSVPNGTGGEPPSEIPPDPQDQVYAIGIALLTSAEVTEKNARSFLAMQVKAHTAPVVVDALQRCAAEKPIQPVPWLVSALKSKAKRTSRHAGFDQLDYTEGINADGSFV